MKRIVIADDLTGANAVSVLLKKNGVDVITWIGKMEGMPCAEAYVLTTDSRGLSRNDAYEKVLALMKQLKHGDACIFAKRIDSTMRGNIGSELDGMLDVLGKDTAVVCTPAYPDSGRCVVNGELLVHGKPVTETGIADDPKSRIFTSNVKNIICGQSKYKACNIFLNDIRCGAERLSALLDEVWRAGSRIMVCDAESNEDIVRIAQALRMNSRSFITADSGVLTAEIVKREVHPGTKLLTNKVLAVIGSVNAAAGEQLEELWNADERAGKVIVDTLKLIQRSQQKAEIRRIVEEAGRLKSSCNIVAIAGDGIYPEKRLKMTEDLSNMINDAFAGIAYEILKEQKEFRGLYSSGGDITRAVYEKCGIKGVSVLDEVLPLAVYGELIGGEFAGLKVVTKGGSQGKRNAICQCVTYLLQHIQ